ncbi:SDR family oxidoreductase [Massilia sp. G4R7]|uniref:SDR family oxidoreductase n=1 Tax=Massilia phyllostachyos TaxID=2898585 RepID=A0ABS8QAK3_9BURK|nr:SDR family oxidoreductase [Massilia phyllostachyos]MCD2518759.1 SDR family oxidoreductase [Massilia phyllostachyos]
MKLSNIRVVIMGASSGIGAATAVAFAREGAQLVLGARGKDGLDDVVQRCRQAGGSADALVVDATDADAVATFASKARDILGRIDLWFSNVGAGVVGKYVDVPLEDHRRVIETNLLTHMNDAHAVLPIFLEQDRGIWVNMISVGGFVPSPYAAAYTASKYGLRGFSEALRAELGRRPDIHVCDVYPTFVDSPGFSHGANYTGAKLSYPPGALKPETVADAVVALARRPRPTTAVGAPASLFRLANFAAPNLLAAGMNRFLERWERKAERVPDTRGALYEPPSGASGIHSGQRRASAPQRNKALVVGAVALGALFGAQLLKKR